MAVVLRLLSSSACRKLRSLSSNPSIISSSSSSTTTSIREISSSSSRFLSLESPANNRFRVLDRSAPWNRAFSAVSSQLPKITDPDIESAFKVLMATSWVEFPCSVVRKDTMKALEKATEDKAGQEVLGKVIRAAEIAAWFDLGVLNVLRRELDWYTRSRNVGPFQLNIESNMDAAYRRYMGYLDSFGPDEAYLREKVETETGAEIMRLKMG